MTRLKIVIRGAVQGVGFRPFIYRLATELRLAGWVHNSSEGVVIEVEGEHADLEKFSLRIQQEKPTLAVIQSLEFSYLDPIGYTGFEIRPSVDGEKRACVLPDIAACPECVREFFDPANRRYQYPFTNCTHCGPRFSIIESLPYDRVNTSMKQFRMCELCQAEYDNPLDRRFHAQPNACPACGPQLQLWNCEGRTTAEGGEALSKTVQAIRDGNIVAIKGLGGFHLMVDARNELAVQRLRVQKHREEKPFALMMPSRESISEYCEVNALEERALQSPEAPIVILKRRSPDLLAPSIAPRNPYFGVMLAYTPLHHLLMREFGFPVVATSGNISDEPICTDEHEALERLGGIADLFLVHNRPIVRHVDDSIVRVVLGREMVLRRARGFAPLPIHLAETLPPVLAVGGHLKNTIASSVDQNIFISQHIGDLETEKSRAAFFEVIQSFRQLYEFQPEMIACDPHPDYISTQFANSSGIPVTPVQHHYAHVMSCMTENELSAPALGIAWDGTGYGLDGTIWGGEFLKINENGFDRVAHFRTFPLPGGEKAVKEPRRVALGLLFEIFGEDLFLMKDWDIFKAFSSNEMDVLKSMLIKKINCPLTSSVGRLFDGVASLAGLHQILRFEGQAAMDLEFALDGLQLKDVYPFLLTGENPIVIDWESFILEILAEVRSGKPLKNISVKFHNTLTEIIVKVARQIGEEKVVLSGGCFQNKYLTERAVAQLRDAGFRPYWHQRVPPNDGGLALGQVAVAFREMKRSDYVSVRAGKNN